MTLGYLVVFAVAAILGRCLGGNGAHEPRGLVDYSAVPEAQSS
jgi:hypothetical protein